MPGRSTAADGMDDFHAVAIVQQPGRSLTSRNDFTIDFDGNATPCVIGRFQ